MAFISLSNVQPLFTFYVYMLIKITLPLKYYKQKYDFQLLFELLEQPGLQFSKERMNQSSSQTRSTWV